MQDFGLYWNQSQLSTQRELDDLTKGLETWIWTTFEIPVRLLKTIWFVQETYEFEEGSLVYFGFKMS